MIRLRLTRRSAAHPALIAGRGRFSRAAWRRAALSDITLHSRGQ
jgi:hypothetical protein